MNEYLLPFDILSKKQILGRCLSSYVETFQIDSIHRLPQEKIKKLLVMSSLE